MDTEQRKAQVTEFFVRMDCNGCVQKIKRALHNLDGIYEVYIDVAHQKLTVVGRVEPEKIVKAIKKTRKIATICTPAEATTEPSSSETPPAEQEANSTESTNQAPIEAAPPLDPPKETTPAENKGPDVKPVPESNEASTSKPKAAGEIHMNIFTTGKLLKGQRDLIITTNNLVEMEATLLLCSAKRTQMLAR
ncbi:copper transport protein CCH isoform X2 [Dendrobium catenatum]|uniref:copper transport protein CCH isoform X2 n=1 Tax=Dendrobium catenatum TaxID=906689 RepID=UPI0010A0AFE9|nr:copper transport protein CCH isoform X2 [Dendrobium catenatum]